MLWTNVIGFFSLNFLCWTWLKLWFLLYFCLSKIFWGHKCVNHLWLLCQNKEDTKNWGSAKVHLHQKTWVTLLILFDYPIYSLHITFSIFSVSWLLCPIRSWRSSMWLHLTIPFQKKVCRGNISWWYLFHGRLVKNFHI